MFVRPFKSSITKKGSQRAGCYSGVYEAFFSHWHQELVRICSDCYEGIASDGSEGHVVSPFTHLWLKNLSCRLSLGLQSYLLRFGMTGPGDGTHLSPTFETKVRLDPYP